MIGNRPGDGSPPAATSYDTGVLLGKCTLGDLRRRARAQRPVADDVAAREPKLAPPASRRWLRRSVRHPLAVLFLGLGAATTASLVFAASRLDDDGSLSGVDWFRLIIVGIVAMALFAQVLVFVSRVPPLGWIRQVVNRRRQPSVPPPLAHIPSVEPVALAGRTGDRFGRLSAVERARFRNQTRLDDLFWITINLAIIGFGTFASYGLGYTALRDLSNGVDHSWAVVRLVLFVLTVMGLARVLRMSIAQLRMRRQRRRRRAIRRLLRYLLWWDRPVVVAAPTAIGSIRFLGPTTAAVGGVTTFLLCCGMVVAAAAYSPWGEPISTAASGAVAGPAVADGVGTSTGTTTDDLASVVSDTTVSDGADASDGATATVTTDESSPVTEPGASTTSAPGSVTPPPGFDTTTTAVGPSSSSTTEAPTTTPTTATTTATTTTTEAPAPAMVINSFSAVFFCDSGTTRFDVSWSVSGDPAGRVDIYRNGPDGFNQIGTAVGFNSSLVNTPPVNGNYQYWLIANNSDFEDEAAVRDVGTVNTNCID